MGLDWGTKRIGIAISDRDASIAHGRSTYLRTNKESDISYIKNFVLESEAKEVVIGLPLDMEGTEGMQAKKARAFKEELEKEIDIPVKEVDERLTSKEAERVLIEADVGRDERNRVRDRLAAVLILQRYLDRLN